MALSAAVSGIQILLLGFTFPTLVSTVLICGLVAMAMRTVEKEANETLQRVTTSLTDAILPELEQQIRSVQQHSNQTLSDVSSALARLQKCRAVLDKIPDRAPKDIKLALRGMTLMQNEISHSLSESRHLDEENKQLVKGIELTRKALKRARFSYWQEEHLLDSIKPKSKDTSFQSSHLN